MSLNYLHHHKDYKELIRAVAAEKRIASDLIEKDYWIMHSLYGLSAQGYRFELKGGTSLSKGFGIISRKAFYDQLALDISIDGIEEVARDEAFDDTRYRSAGIRLKYSSLSPISQGVKDGVLLEVGFDTVTPNQQVDISSWALDFAKKHNMPIIDNEAKDITCYEPGYTFVEKLQTIATKFRNQQQDGSMPKNFMRHYYDIYCLLENESVKNFIGTDAYEEHKQKRFPKVDIQIPIAENEAFLLTDTETRNLYTSNYQATAALYCNLLNASINRDNTIEQQLICFDKGYVFFAVWFFVHGLQNYFCEAVTPSRPRYLKINWVRDR